jgi:hypothetical protein
MKKLLDEWKQFLESEVLISEARWPGLRGKTAEIEQATRDLMRKQRQEREAPPPAAPSEPTDPLVKRAMEKGLSRERAEQFAKAFRAKLAAKKADASVPEPEVSAPEAESEAALERISPEVSNALLLSVPRVLDGRGQGGEGFLDAIIADAKLQNPDMAELEKETIADELRRVVEDAVSKYGENIS